MTASALSCKATTGTLALDVVDVRVRLDESIAPFADAQLTIPYTPALADLLDPRAVPAPRVKLALTQRFSGSKTLAAETVEYSGKTLADETVEYSGKTLADETVKYGVAWNPTGFRRTRRLDLDLGVRERRVNHRSATITLDLASDEALLTDYGLLSTTAVSPAALTVLAAVQLALGRAVPGAVLSTTEGAQTITADAAVWQPGVSAWTYLAPITAAADLRLWCDERRVWHLAAPESVLTPGTAVLSTTDRVLDATDEVSRDGSEWFDGVVVTYDWTDGSGVRHVQHDIAGPDTATRVLHITHQRPYPRAGEATARLRKVQGHGRVLGITAVADPEVYPAQAATLTVPDSPAQNGFVQAVEWALPADTMTVTTRDLVDTPPTSWLFAQPGQAWQDIPVGMAWNELNWTEVA